MKKEYICKQELIEQIRLMLNRTSLGEIRATTDISIGTVCSLINDMATYTDEDIINSKAEEANPCEYLSMERAAPWNSDTYPLEYKYFCTKDGKKKELGSQKEQCRECLCCGMEKPVEVAMSLKDFCIGMEERALHMVFEEKWDSVSKQIYIAGTNHNFSKEKNKNG